MRFACEMLECNEWKIEKIVALTGDRIQSIQRKKFGKIYRLTVHNIFYFSLKKKFHQNLFICNFLWILIIKGQMNLPAKILMERLYYGIENMPSWNPTLMESKILKVKQLTSPKLFRQQ